MDINICKQSNAILLAKGKVLSAVLPVLFSVFYSMGLLAEDNPLLDEPVGLSIVNAPVMTDEEKVLASNNLRLLREAQIAELTSSKPKILQALSSPSLRSISVGPGVGSGDDFSAGSLLTNLDDVVAGLESDPTLIYQYVRNNIQFEAVRGLLRNPEAVLIDGRGTAFDQANLLMKLLRKAGFDADLAMGEIRIDGTVFHRWFGSTGENAVPQENGTVVDVNFSIVNILANSGYGSGIAAMSNSGGVYTLHYVTIDHVWVKASIGGQDYRLDPSFKFSTDFSGANQPVDIDQYMAEAGYDRNNFLAAALSGASYANNALSNLNTGAITNHLTDISNGLVDKIRTEHPNATLDELIGGTHLVVDESSLAEASLLPEGITEESAPLISSEVLPADRIKVDFVLAKRDFGQILLGNYASFYADELYGKRLLVDISNSSQPQILLDGATQESWSAVTTADSLELKINMDFPSYTTLSDHSRTVAGLNAGGMYLIANRWSRVGQGQLRYHQKRLQQYRAEGLADDSEAVLGEGLAITAASYTSQYIQQMELYSKVHGLSFLNFVTLGVVGYLDNSTYIDLPVNIVATLDRVTGNGVAEELLLGFSGFTSVLESGVIEQTYEQPGVSTVAAFHNYQQSGETFYYADTNNWSAIKPNLQGYPASLVTSIESTLTSPSSEYYYVLPRSYTFQEGNFTGFAQVRGVGNSSIGYLIGAAKGGWMTQPSTLSNQAIKNLTNNYTPPAFEFSSLVQKSLDPIALPTGDFVLDHDDLTVGSDTFPVGLGFQRNYNSGAWNVTKTLGRGWGHNFDIKAREDTDGYQSLGQDSALDATAMLVALYIVQDLNVEASTNVELDRFMTSMAVQKWGMDQMTKNVVDITLPGNTKRFVKLPDGSYNPPPASAAELTLVGNSYRYKDEQGVTFTFNDDGTLSTWEDLAGFTVNFSYLSGGKLQTVSNDAQYQLNINYDGDKIDSVDDNNGRSVSFGYDGNDNLTSFTDANDHTTNYGYDQPGRMTTIKYPANPANNFVRNIYDANGRVTDQYNAHDEHYQYFYSGVRTKEVDPAGNPHIWHFDSQGKTTKEVDRLDRVTRSEYDNKTRLEKRTFPEGNSVSFGYDINHNVIQAVQHSKPCDGAPGCVELPDITVNSSYRLSDNRLEWSEDAEENRTDYHYNGVGQVTKIEAPAATQGGPRPTTEFQNYNSCGKPERVISPETIVQEAIFDLNCNLEESTLIGDSGERFTTVHGYDPEGNRTSETDPETGEITQFSYDDNRNLTRIDALASTEGAHSEIVYDEEDQVLQQKIWDDERQEYLITSQTYTVSGQVETITDAENNTTTNQYDNIDRLEFVIDPLDRKTKTVYDKAGQVLEIHLAVDTPLEQIYRKHTWSDNGKLVSVTDAKGNETTYDYDTHDRLILTTMPDTTTVQQLNIDDRGNVGTIINREGQSISFTYDNLSRVTFKDSPSGEADVTYQYDLEGKPDLITDTDSNSYDYAYDTAGRLTSVTDHNNRAVSYEYNKGSKLTKTTYPGNDNFYLSYGYDNLNRSTHIYQGDIATGTLLAEYGYNSLNQRSSLQINGNVAAVAYAQDKVGQLTDLDYGITPQSPDLSIGYDHDGANQLTRRFYTDGSYAWQNTNQVITQYSAANNLNQYTSATYTGDTSTSINYDLNGNLIAFNGHTYNYDSQNRLTQITTPSHQLDYHYNPMGQRIRKISTPNQEPTIETDYFHSGSNEVAEYIDGALVARYVYGPGTDEVLAQIKYTGAQGSETETSRNFYYTDGLGSVIASLTSDGTVTKKYTYSPFGLNDAANDHSDQPWGYTGQRYDEDSGLYYYKARYYHVSLGRFLSVDPVGYDDQMNLYAYVANSPLLYRDPSGRVLESVKNGASEAWNVASTTYDVISSFDFRYDENSHSYSYTSDLYGNPDTIFQTTNQGSIPFYDGYSDGHHILWGLPFEEGPNFLTPNPIIHTSDRILRTSTNYALPTHVFQGDVEHSVIDNGGNSVTVTTVGTGSGGSLLSNDFNNLVGFIGFMGLHIQLNLQYPNPND